MKRDPDTDTNSWRTHASQAELRSFVRMAAPAAMAAQLQHVISRHEPSLTNWLEALLEEGRFDVEKHSVSDNTVPLASALPMVRSLATLLKTRVESAVRRPGSQEVVAADESIPDWSRASWHARPAFCPDGLPDVLDRIAQRLFDSAAAAFIEVDGRSTLAVRNDSLSLVLACAASIDHHALVSHWVDHPTFGTAHWKFPFVPLDFIGTPDNMDRSSGQKLSIHLGMVAANFGADRTIQTLIDRQWQLASRAGWAGCSLDYGHSLSLPNVLGKQWIKFQPSSVKILVGTMTHNGLTENDRQTMGVIVDIALDKHPAPGAWSRILMDTGLAFANPEQTFRRAARGGHLDMLQALDNEIDWWGKSAVSGPGQLGHPAMPAVTNMDDTVTPERRLETLVWLTEAVARRGPQACAFLFDQVDGVDKSFAEHVIELDRPDVLHRLLEIGLDPALRLNERSRSALDATVDHGRPQCESVVRSWLSRRAALETIDSLQLGLDEITAACKP